MPTPDALDVKLAEEVFDSWREQRPVAPAAVVWAKQLNAMTTIAETMRRCGIGSRRYQEVEAAQRRSLEYITAIVSRTDREERRA